MPPPLQYADLIFPSQAPIPVANSTFNPTPSPSQSTSQTLKSLHRTINITSSPASSSSSSSSSSTANNNRGQGHGYALSNRLHSIARDATFVSAVACAFARPLVANERCGSWYVPPGEAGVKARDAAAAAAAERKTESVYFKSTDGHAGQWGFSFRRVNGHLLRIVGRGDGCIIVDSTRRGKRMPDALSKTVPIWCTVLNRVLFPDNRTCHALHTPPQVVSKSEHAQIEDRLDGFVKQLKALNLPLSEWRALLQKPLRPIWITPESTFPDTPPTYPDFHPLILCTASRMVHNSDMAEGGYVQGAADDSESWAQGLSPIHFWRHKNRLLTASPNEIEDLIKEIVLSESTRDRQLPPGLNHDSLLSLVKPTTCIYLGDSSVLSNLTPADYDAIVICSAKPDPSLEAKYTRKCIHLACPSGKLGGRLLRKELPKMQKTLDTLQSFSRLLFCCATGRDLSVGAALVALCLYFNEDGESIKSNNNLGRTFDKEFIRQRLIWIQNSVPQANPSRATLQSVNSFLMS